MTPAYAEQDLLPISGLQHLAFCERRWALVQIESIWTDNRFTAEGNTLHKQAHSGEIESRPGSLIRRTLLLHSFRLGLTGQSDIVEFYPSTAGVKLDGRSGFWLPFPIEYKRRGERAGSKAYQVQLCAQALCLEEMLQVPVTEGAIYDGTTRRRQAVAFTPELRARTEALAARMHLLFDQCRTPPPILTKGCQSCSLAEDCHPEALSATGRVHAYLEGALQHLVTGPEL